jgi:hypothetical protein
MPSLDATRAQRSRRFPVRQKLRRAPCGAWRESVLVKSRKRMPGSAGYATLRRRARRGRRPWPANQDEQGVDHVFGGRPSLEVGGAGGSPRQAPIRQPEQLDSRRERRAACGHQHPRRPGPPGGDGPRHLRRLELVETRSVPAAGRQPRGTLPADHRGASRRSSGPLVGIHVRGSCTPTGQPRVRPRRSLLRGARSVEAHNFGKERCP